MRTTTLLLAAFALTATGCSGDSEAASADCTPVHASFAKSLGVTGLRAMQVPADATTAWPDAWYIAGPGGAVWATFHDPAGPLFEAFPLNAEARGASNFGAVWGEGARALRGLSGDSPGVDAVKGCAPD